MKLIIEIEGALVDVAPTHYEVHRRVAAEVGWARLDQATFWRLTRTKGREANLLPGARPVKLKEYHRRFEQCLESDEVLARLGPRARAEEILRDLGRYGELCLITLGSNVEARRRVLERAGLLQHVKQTAALDPDPRLRAGELRAMAGGDPRTVVAATTDPLIRAAGQAGLFTVGVACGACAAPRLERAGADIVYGELRELVQSLTSGAPDLVRAGLLPAPLD